MFILKEQTVVARFRAMAAFAGAPTLATAVVPGQVAPIHNVAEFDAVRHDEALFVKHLAGKSPVEAAAIFETFKAELKIDGLRAASEVIFRRSFLHEYR